MILNLLDVSKGDEGRLSPKRAPTKPVAMLEEVVGGLDAHAKSRRVDLEASSDVETASFDADLVQRMLTNLVENAIRHAPSGSKVTVHCSKADTGVEFRVTDQGVGVPADMRQKIFDPFVQVEAGTERPVTRSGRGLGLAFCKLVAEAHDGRIWVEDGRPGSIFCVRLSGGE
jgi:signal transduction histidine kinase